MPLSTAIWNPAVLSIDGCLIILTANYPNTSVVRFAEIPVGTLTVDLGDGPFVIPLDNIRYVEEDANGIIAIIPPGNRKYDATTCTISGAEGWILDANGDDMPALSETLAAGNVLKEVLPYVEPRPFPEYQAHPSLAFGRFTGGFFFQNLIHQTYLQWDLNLIGGAEIEVTSRGLPINFTGNAVLNAISDGGVLPNDDMVLCWRGDPTVEFEIGNGPQLETSDVTSGDVRYKTLSWDGVQGDAISIKTADDCASITDLVLCYASDWNPATLDTNGMLSSKFKLLAGGLTCVRFAMQMTTIGTPSFAKVTDTTSADHIGYEQERTDAAPILSIEDATNDPAYLAFGDYFGDYGSTTDSILKITYDGPPGLFVTGDVLDEIEGAGGTVVDDEPWSVWRVVSAPIFVPDPAGSYIYVRVFGYVAADGINYTGGGTVSIRRRFGWSPERCAEVANALNEEGLLHWFWFASGYHDVEAHRLDWFSRLFNALNPSIGLYLEWSNEWKHNAAAPYNGQYKHSRYLANLMGPGTTLGDVGAKVTTDLYNQARTYWPDERLRVVVAGRRGEFDHREEVLDSSYLTCPVYCTSASNYWREPYTYKTFSNVPLSGLIPSACVTLMGLSLNEYSKTWETDVLFAESRGLEHHHYEGGDHADLVDGDDPDLIRATLAARFHPRYARVYNRMHDELHKLGSVPSQFVMMSQIGDKTQWGLLTGYLQNPGDGLSNVSYVDDYAAGLITKDEMADSVESPKAQEYLKWMPTVYPPVPPPPTPQAVAEITTPTHPSVTDFTYSFDLSNLSTEWWDQVENTDPLRMKVTLSDGVTRVPCDLVNFDFDNRKGYLYFMRAGASTGNEKFRVFSLNKTDDIIETNHAYGRNNAYDSHTLFFSPDCGDDRTATGAIATTEGTTSTKPIPIPGQVGTGSLFYTPHSAVGWGNVLDRNVPFTVSAWVNPSALTAQSTVLARRETALLREWHFRIDATGNLQLLTTSGSLNSSQSVGLNEWNRVVVQINEVGEVTFWKNKVSDIPVGTLEITNGMNSVLRTGCALVSATQQLTGIIDEIRYEDVVRSSDWLDLRYDLEADNASQYSITYPETGGTVLDFVNSRYEDLTPVTHTLPASVRAVWDATQLTDLTGVTQLLDTSGNGHHMTFGATAPTLGTNPRSGLNYLAFEQNVTDKLSTAANFLDGIDTTSPFAMILVSTPIAVNTTESGAVLGDEVTRRTLRYNGFQGFSFQGSGMTPPIISRLNLEHDLDDTVMFGLHFDGTNLRIEVFTDFQSGQNDFLGTSYPYREDSAVQVSATLAGRVWSINEALHGMHLYGAMYLDNPAPGDYLQARKYVTKNWQMGQREKVIMFQGDSTTNRVQTVGYMQHLEDLIGEDRYIGQNFGQGGRRAIDGPPFTGLNQDDVAESYNAYVEYWNSAAPNGVICPIMIGTNDIGADGADPQDVIDAIYEWSDRIDALGGQTIWLQCCPNHQSSTPGEGRPKVSVDIRDQTIAETNTFSGWIDVLEDDSVWAWLGSSADRAPELFEVEDGTHPNSDGNLDLATKWEPSFSALLFGEIPPESSFKPFFALVNRSQPIGI